MEVSIQNELLASFQQKWQPPYSGSIDNWAHNNVYLHNEYSMPGMFDVNCSRFLIEPLGALANPKIRQVNLMASPRCAKTLAAELWLLHTISTGASGASTGAGSFLWLQSNEQMAAKMVTDRIVPLIQNCHATNDLLPRSRYAITKDNITFPHMKVHVTSAKIKALQSKGYKYICFDEVWMLEDPSFIEEARARLGDFISTSKYLLLSQGRFKKDFWDNEFNKGKVYEWGWICPNCNKEQVLEWYKQREDESYGGINWCPDDKHVMTIEERAKTAFLECFHCRHQIADHPQNRRYLNDHGLYICTKPEGKSEIASYRWNALANAEIPFATLAEEFMFAKSVAKMEGNREPLKIFKQKRLAQGYDTNSSTNEVKILTEQYDPNSAWPMEAFRFMTIDCQKDLSQFYYVICSWARNAECRQLARGVASSLVELQDIQKRHNVKNVFIDVGYQGTSIHSFCVRNGKVYQNPKTKVSNFYCWIGLKGDGRKEPYPHKDGSKKIYNVASFGDPNLGKGVRQHPYHLFSNRLAKDILAHLRDGRGSKFICSNSDEEYQRQMYSEEYNPNNGNWEEKQGVPNHYWDCNVMQIVAAAMVGILGNMETKSSIISN